MKTKEAIRFCVDLQRQAWNMYFESYDDKKQEYLEGVIELLQQGEKYRNMLLQIKKIADDVHYHNDAENNCELISEIIEDNIPKPVKNKDYFYEATSKDPHLKKIKFKKGGN